MAGSFSDTIENALLDHLLGGPDYVRPATVHIALFTVAPTDAGGGTEVAGGSYARVAKTNNAANFPAAAAGAKSNGTEIRFVRATGNWGELVASAIFDAASGGSMLTWSDLNVPKTISSGDQAFFDPGELDVFLQ